jgi:peptidoglycan LD-endopeptidase LytH
MRSAVRWSIVVVLIWAVTIGIALWLAYRYKILPRQKGVAQIDPVTTEETALASPPPFVSPSIAEPTPSIEPTPTPEPSTVAELPGQQNPIEGTFVGIVKLVIPVAGVRPNQLIDTFDDARSEGRVHDAIDIPAPAGTTVIAAADGEIIKLFHSERGGTTIYQLSADKKLVFYYAHLQGYAPNLREGMVVRQGDAIAYVGDTGNAGVGNYHLHFSIAVLADPKRYWEGTNINPYPLLHR